MDFGYVQINVGTPEEPVWINGLPRAVRLVGGPRDGEVTDGVPDDYAETTTTGTDRTAIYAGREGGPQMETTYETRMAVARDECRTSGHTFCVEQVYGISGPDFVHCSRCGSIWRIHPDDHGKDFGRKIDSPGPASLPLTE